MRRRGPGDLVLRAGVLGLGLLAALLDASAAANAGGGFANTLSVNTGGAMMFNTKNGLHPPASDVGLAWTRPGEWGGWQVEINHLAFFTAYETDQLVGLRGAWTLRLPRRTLYPFATLGAGLYLTSVAPVLPIGQLALGARKDFPNRYSVSLELGGWASLFAVGLNPRLAVGYAF
jgi:hypothetical protein